MVCSVNTLIGSLKNVRNVYNVQPLVQFCEKKCLFEIKQDNSVGQMGEIWWSSFVFMLKTCTRNDGRGVRWFALLRSWKCCIVMRIPGHRSGLMVLRRTHVVVESGL